MKIIGRTALIAGLVVGLVATALPASAATSTTPVAATSEIPATASQATLQWNCDEMTDADRQKAINEGIQMCGLNGSSHGAVARGSNTNNCGTAYIYVGQAGGRARVDYSLHSTAGIITGRALHVWWGPTAGGSKDDIGTWWGTGFYGNQTDIGYAMKGKTFGATMSGTVTIAGWTLTCGVYVNEPSHNL